MPSINDPSTEGKFYYSGGFNTLKHGSSNSGGPISSIQLELPKPGVRETETDWKNYSNALVFALEKYFKIHYGIDL